MGNQFLGRADTATKLETPRTIFSQSFDGTANIGGQALVYGTGADTSRYINGGLQVRESGLVGNTQYDNRYSPRIGFRWAGRAGSNIIINSTGNFLFTDADDGDYRAVYAKTFIGALSGNATSATTATTATSANKWTTARTLTLSGNASGSVSFDGSANMALNITNHYATGSDSSNWLNVPDTRGTNPAPSALTRSVRFEFKRHATINNPYGNDTYNGLMSAAFYSDASGGNRYQIAFGSNMATIPYLSMRTNPGGATSWGDWKLLPTMSADSGFWGFDFPSNNTYLRTPPDGLLPNAASSSGLGYVGTSVWPFLAMYAKKFYGDLSGNAATATNASQLGGTAASGYLKTTGGTLSGSTSKISRAGTSSSWYNGRTNALFTTSSVTSGIYAPLWSAKSATGSWDVGTYTNDTLYFSFITDTNFNAGTNSPKTQIVFGDNGVVMAPYFDGDLLGNANTATTATNSNQLGGVAAANYINTSDTLILRGTV